MKVHHLFIAAAGAAALPWISSGAGVAAAAEEDGIAFELETVCAPLAGGAGKENCQVLHLAIGGIEVPLQSTQISADGYVLTQHIGKVIVDAQQGGFTNEEKLAHLEVLKKLKPPK